MLQINSKQFNFLFIIEKQFKCYKQSGQYCNGVLFWVYRDIYIYILLNISDKTSFFHW